MRDVGLARQRVGQEHEQIVIGLEQRLHHEVVAPGDVRDVDDVRECGQPFPHGHGLGRGDAEPDHGIDPVGRLARVDDRGDADEVRGDEPVAARRL